MFDGLGRRYGQRPSVLAGIRDEALALSFDLACSEAGADVEARARQESDLRARMKGFTG